MQNVLNSPATATFHIKLYKPKPGHPGYYRGRLPSHKAPSTFTDTVRHSPTLSDTDRHCATLFNTPATVAFQKVVISRRIITLSLRDLRKKQLSLCKTCLIPQPQRLFTSNSINQSQVIQVIIGVACLPIRRPQHSPTLSDTLRHCPTLTDIVRHCSTPQLL